MEANGGFSLSLTVATCFKVPGRHFMSIPNLSACVLDLSTVCTWTERCRVNFCGCCIDEEQTCRFFLLASGVLTVGPLSKHFFW